MENGKETFDELSRLFDYPSVGELFSSADTRRVDDFCAGLERKKYELEGLIRRGSREDAERASRAVKGLEVTIEFLHELQQKRRG